MAITITMTILMPELRGKYSGPVVNQGEPRKRVQKLRSKGDIESPNLQPCRPKNYDEKKDRICNHVRLHSVFQAIINTHTCHIDAGILLCHCPTLFWKCAAKFAIEFKAQEKERSPCRQLHTSLTAGYQPTIQATWT